MTLTNEEQRSLAGTMIAQESADPLYEVTPVEDYESALEALSDECIMDCFGTTRSEAEATFAQKKLDLPGLIATRDSEQAAWDASKTATREVLDNQLARQPRPKPGA